MPRNGSHSVFFTLSAMYYHKDTDISFFFLKQEVPLEKWIFYRNCVVLLGSGYCSWFVSLLWFWSSESHTVDCLKVNKKKPMVNFSSCPYPSECLLCYYFTPFKNILTPIFCFALSWLSRKDNWNLFLLGCTIIVSSEDYLALFLYCSDFRLCFWFLKLLPFGLFHFMQSCTLLAHLPCLICVGPAISLF